MTPALIPFMLFLVILPFPGTVAARLLLLVTCFAIAVYQWLRTPGARAPIPNKGPIALWITVCLASVPFAADPAYSLREIQNEIGYTMMAFFAFFTVARDGKAASALMRALCGGTFLIGILSLWCWGRSGFAAWPEVSFTGGSGIVATYVVTVFPCLVWLAVTERARTWRRAALIAVGLLLVLGILTKQRALWPALTLESAGIIALTVAHVGLPNCGRRCVYVTIAAVVAFGIAGMTWSQHARLGGESGSRMLQVSMGDARLAFWPKVAATIVDHPLVGAGFGRSALQKAYPELVPLEFRRATLLWHGHNLFLNYGISLGFPGIVAIVALLGGFGLLFWRSSPGALPWPAIAGLAMLLGVVVRNQTNDFFVRDMSLLFWALMGVTARLAVVGQREPR